MNDHKTSTPTLVSALRILAGEIQSDDGVANMTIAEAADRIEELKSDLARVTAERDAQAGACREASQHAAKAMEDRDALRARVAELEKDNKQYSADFRAQQKKLTEHDRELAKTTAALKLTQQLLDRAEQRNAELDEKAERYRLTTLRQDATIAELVAALADIRDMPEYDQDDAHRLRDKAKQALARSESATPEVVQESLTTEPATPANHPDTELLEWLFGNTIIAGPDGRVIDCRDDVDAARKQGGTS